MHRQLKGSIMLLLTALIWGTNFVAQSLGMNYVEPFTYNAMRSLLGGAVLLPVIAGFKAFDKKKTSQKAPFKDASRWHPLRPCPFRCKLAPAIRHHYDNRRQSRLHHCPLYRNSTAIRHDNRQKAASDHLALRCRGYNGVLSALYQRGLLCRQGRYGSAAVRVLLCSSYHGDRPLQFAGR